MITKELIKTEIDNVQDEYLEVLYRFIKSLEISVIELNNVTDTNTKRGADRSLKIRKEQFFDFIKKYSFTLPENYTFNREEIHER
ncbi:MAG: hypothetical protein GY797_33060 [Deltaproteobacteria bacterium]|nr:hypothetical protein [Deltaproteobacteria bacterium]